MDHVQQAILSALQPSEKYILGVLFLDELMNHTALIVDTLDTKYLRYLEIVRAIYKGRPLAEKIQVAERLIEEGTYIRIR